MSATSAQLPIHVGRSTFLLCCAFIFTAAALYGMAMVDVFACLTHSSKAGSAVASLTKTGRSGKSSHPVVMLPFYRPIVSRVIFSGDHIVSTDAGQPYRPPRCEDASAYGNANRRGESHYPVCYTRGAIMSVSACFKLEHNLVAHGVKVVGIGPDHLKFTTTVDVNGDRSSFIGVQANRKLPDTIRFFDSFRIRWKISFDDGVSWCPAGTTDNRLYVTLGDPQTSPLYETLLDIGCRNAQGDAEPAAAVNSIWADFAKRNADGSLPGVRRKAIDGLNRRDGQVMRYWLEENDPLLSSVSEHCHALAEMLDPFPSNPKLNGVGTCQAWTELFERVIRAQGITNLEIVVVMPGGGANYAGAGFMIKTPSFLRVSAAVPRRSALPMSVVHGQGTINPPAGFINHSLVLFEGAYYDPSCGNGPFTGATDLEAKQAWERATLAAFVVDEFHGGITNRVLRPLSSPNPLVADNRSVQNSLPARHNENP